MSVDLGGRGIIKKRFASRDAPVSRPKSTRRTIGVSPTRSRTVGYVHGMPRGSLSGTLGDAPRAREAAVALVERLDLDVLPGLRRVDHAAVADVDADVTEP